MLFLGENTSTLIEQQYFVRDTAYQCYNATR